MCARKNIAVFSLQGYGNNMLALPLAAGLKAQYPDSELVFVINGSRFLEITSKLPFIDQTIVFGNGTLAGISKLRQGNCEIAAFSFPAGRRSFAYARFAGIPKRVGHDHPSFFGSGLTTSVAWDENGHDLDQNMNLAKALGVTVALDEFWPPLKDIPEGYVQEGRRVLEQIGLDPDCKYAGFHTGSDSRFVEKRYSPENFGKVAEMVFEKYNLPAVVFEGPAEAGTGMRMAAATKTPVYVLDPKLGMGATWGLLGGCKVFVSNDSGMMNMASATGIPTLGLFGPSRVERTRPYQGRYLKSDWRCSPCHSLEQYRGCPFPYRNCMDAMEPAAVFEQVVKLMES